jgi:hypothetical protein
VRTLLERGAGPTHENKIGLTPLRLTVIGTGRGRSGPAVADAQEAEIVRRLGAYGPPK